MATANHINGDDTGFKLSILVKRPAWNYSTQEKKSLTQEELRSLTTSFSALGAQLGTVWLRLEKTGEKNRDFYLSANKSALLNYAAIRQLPNALMLPMPAKVKEV